MKIIKTLHRIYLEEKELQETIQSYEDLYCKDYYIRFDYTRLNLTLVQIGGILLLAGTAKTWDALPDIKRTGITMIVDSIREMHSYFLALDHAIILHDPKEVPTGWNMTVQSREGTIIEYVQHHEDKIGPYKKKTEELRFE